MYADQVNTRSAESIPVPQRRALVSNLPLRFGLLNLALTALALVYVWHFSQRTNTDVYERGWRLVGSLIVTVVSVNLEVQLMLSLGGRRRWLRVTLGTLLALTTICLLAYHLESGVSLDPSVVIEHRDLRLSRDVLQIIASSFDYQLLLVGAGITALLLAIEWRWAWTFREQPGAAWRNALFAAFGLGLLFQTPIVAYDEVSEVVRPYLRWNTRVSARLPPGEFPLVHATPPPAYMPRRPKQAIFLILVESFNANVVEAKAPNGLTYTPFFNSLIPRGLYIDRFYGNSVQTAKGHFATLCSLVPNSGSREFVRMADTHLQCLPEILRKAGYKTIFFQAFPEIDYDNTEGFLRRNGFEIVESVSKYQQDVDSWADWGWGLQDDPFYRRFFEHLDDIYPTADPEKPLFVTLAPISNHMRFDQVPEDERKIYPDPKKPEEWFANTVNVADRGLEAFFAELERREYLRDALVVISGDHSFPVGEHGYYHNETNAYEEFFRVPFLMLAPGQIAPERVHDIPYSQLDIAPSLLEFSGILPEKNHFQGISVFAEPRRVHPIPVLQPYSGRYLGVIDFPYKYVYRVHDGHSRLFNLVDDPHEEQNLASHADYASRKAQLHQLLDMHYVTDAALRQNQVWPRAKKKKK